MEHNMNNIPEMETISPKKKLDTTGGIILVISLILSVIFFTIGFFSFGGKELQLNEERTDSVESYEYTTYEFTPEYSGYYVLYLEDAILSSCADENGDRGSYTSLPSYDLPSGYDHGYYVYIPGRTTYSFEVYSQDDEISLIIQNFYNY